MRKGVLAALVIAAVLAGCAGPAPSDGADGSSTATGATTMSIRGLVQDATFAPVAGANVSLRFLDQLVVTDAGGLFRFDGLVPSSYLVDVTAAGFENATLTAEPPVGDDTVASLEVILDVAQSLRPSQVTTQFHGYLECALEAFIITPSCDSLLTHESVGGPAVFNSTFVYDLGVNANWATVVVDVDFDPSANPGLEGLRVTARGSNDGDSFGGYEQFGRFHGPDDFTFRLEPGQTYADGDVPVPANATLFRLETYPHGHAYHPACAPVFGCPLGAGAGTNIVFDLYVTVFYNQPAPADWSFLDQA